MIASWHVHTSDIHIDSLTRFFFFVCVCDIRRNEDLVHQNTNTAKSKQDIVNIIPKTAL